MALVEGVKYGLSSQGNSSAKKYVIFVKLTDSALRAIEDCLQRQQKTGQHATLQFLGNEGRIHIPSSQSNEGHSFDFSLSSNAEPQGSFECIQQNGSRSLESMGTLPYKMRIHAKEDVYDLTRQKINSVEDKRKQDCAKEIKQPGAENGRKVKKKLGVIVQQPLSRRESSPISNGYSNPKSSLLGNSKFSNGYNNSSSNYYGHHNTSNYKGGGLNSRSNGPSSKMAHGGVNMDVSRRPLRERLIHMLALKPLKKPEIMAKLYRDGWKDKEKKLLMMTLTQVSQMKDNVYNLGRHIWNDVHEDWPFYTEEERQIMKRRKPQNLTPPGSDCSVGSGTSGSSSSPRSTTSGSGHSPTNYTSSSNYSSSNHHNLYSLSNSSSGSYGNAMNKSSSNYSSHNISSNLTGQPIMQQQGVKRPITNAYDNNNNSSGGPGGFDSGGQSNENIPSPKIRRVSHFKRPNCSNGNSSANINNNSNSNGRGGDTRDSPTPKEMSSSKSSSSLQLPSQNPTQTSPYHQQQPSHRTGSSGYNQERWSPTMNGLAPGNNNHRSPKNIKDHHSPPYNSNDSNNVNNLINQSSNHHHSSNQSSQGNYGDDFHSALSEKSSLSRSSRNGHHGSHPPPHHQSSSAHLDNGNGAKLNLSDVEDSDLADSGNGSSTTGASGSQHQSSSVNACVNNHIVNSNNHSGSTKSSSSSSSSASLPSSAPYGHANTNSLVNNSNSNNSLNGASSNSTVAPKRERDYDSSLSNSLPNGCNRVSSTTSSGTASGFHTPQACSPDSQIDPLQQHHPPHHQQPHHQTSSPQQHHKSSRDQLKEVEKERDSHFSENRSGGKIRHGSNGLPSSRDKVKERSRSDRDREKDTAAEMDDCDRPKSEFPDYVLEYPPIRTVEQRNRYKADFNAQYNEYRDLHSVIHEVSKKFAQLEENLRKEEKGSERYQFVRDQIIQEYKYNKSNKRYLDARTRFAYMHKKLSHIKDLVAEFDKSLMHSTPDEVSGPGCMDEDEEALAFCR